MSREREVLGLPGGLPGAEVRVVIATVVVRRLTEAQTDDATCGQATRKTGDAVVVHEFVGLTGLEEEAPLIDAGRIAMVVVAQRHVGAVSARGIVDVARDPRGEAGGLGLFVGHEVVHEPVFHAGGLKATEGADLFVVDIGPRCPGGGEAVGGLIGSRRARTDDEHVALQGGLLGDLSVLERHQPGGLRIVLESFAGARYEDPFEHAHTTARSHGGVGVAHVAALDIREQMLGGIEPQGVIFGVFVVVGEFAGRPQAAGHLKIGADQVDLIAGHDVMELLHIGEGIGHVGPTGLGGRRILRGIARTRDHVPGGDVDAIEVAGIVEETIEVEGLGNVQAATVEGRDVDEAFEPGGEVADLQAIGAGAAHAVFAALAEVGDDVLHVCQRHGLRAAGAAPRQAVAVFGDHMGSGRSVVVEAHGHGLGLVVEAPPSIAVGGEFAAVDPAVGVHAWSVAGIRGVVGVGQRDGVAVAIGLTGTVLVPIARHVGTDGFDGGDTAVLQDERKTSKGYIQGFEEDYRQRRST